MTEPSPYKCADRLTRWPRPIQRLMREIEELDLQLSLLDDLGQRPMLIARRRVLLMQLEAAKVETLRAEVPEL
jgi:hypothetical protein